MTKKRTMENPTFLEQNHSEGLTSDLKGSNWGQRSHCSILGKKNVPRFEKSQPDWNNKRSP